MFSGVVTRSPTLSRLWFSVLLMLATAPNQAAEPAKPEPPVKPPGAAGITPLNAIAGEARKSRTLADLNAIKSAVLMYKLTSGALPTDAQGLKALAEKPAPPPAEWVKIMDRVPLDAWGREYRLFTRTKDGKVERVIGSRGPDEKSEQDDIELVIQSEPAPRSE